MYIHHVTRKFGDHKVNRQIKFWQYYRHIRALHKMHASNRQIKCRQNLIVPFLDQIAKFNACQYFQLYG